MLLVLALSPHVTVLEAFWGREKTPLEKAVTFLRMPSKPRMPSKIPKQKVLTPQFHPRVLLSSSLLCWNEIST